MRMLYTTDLHGTPWKYDALVEQARFFNVDIVAHGGDMLPKKGDLFQQDAFMRKGLGVHFEKLSDLGISCLCCLGNDDLRIWDSAFDDLCRSYTGVHNLAQRKVNLEGFSFIGMNWIADTPFGLKDRCRMDTEEFSFPVQMGPPVLSTSDGWQELTDWFGYARSLPTLAQELADLPTPTESLSAVYLIHMPPEGLKLDVCLGGEAVGSSAVYNFLQQAQPYLALHGHIHESPDVTGCWYANLGETLCLQPGQTHDLTFVLVNLDTLDIARHVVCV